MVHFDPRRKFIFSLYGPTKSGKSSLIEAMIARMPDTLRIIRSVTTRGRRGPEDDANYSQFFSPDEFRERIAQGKMIQHIEYAGNMYGTDREEVDAILSDRHGICAMVEDGMINMMDAGYQLVPVRIIPLNTDVGPGVTRIDEDLRAADDMARARSTIQPLLVIINDFKEGGRGNAIRQLHDEIERFLLNPNLR
ncbi:hypothetical protein ACFLZO_00735 [Patescibacteria group bacterium]